MTHTLTSIFSRSPDSTLIMIPFLIFILASPPSGSAHRLTREWSRPDFTVLPLQSQDSLDSPPPYTSNYWFNWSADIPTNVHT